MIALETSDRPDGLSIFSNKILLLLGPIYFEGRESETIEFSAPADLLRDPIIDDVVYRGLTKQRRQVLNLLTSIPEGMGIMRRSLARTIYPTLPLDLALTDLNSERASLNRFLQPQYEIYNPIDSGGQVPEARYCLRRTGERIGTDKPQVIDWEGIAVGISQKDLDAFDSFYQLTRDSLFRYLFYKTKDPDLVDELMGQIYAKAWEKAERFKWQQVPPQHWLLKVAQNEVVSYWRKQQILKRRVNSIEDLGDISDPDISPPDQTEREFNNELLSRALAKLPAEVQDVLRLRFIEDYSHADVSAVLGKSKVAVRKIQSRGLISLRNSLRTLGYLPS